MKVIVVGTGIEGLLASWVFRQHPGTDVWLVADEADERLTPTAYSTSLAVLLAELRIPSAIYGERAGILLHGRIHTYPQVLHHMSRAELLQVFYDCKIKAGVPSPPKPNGELKRRRNRHLRFDPDELNEKLTRGAQLLPERPWKIAPGSLRAGRDRCPYDCLVLTGPLNAWRSRVWFDVPSLEATELHRAEVNPREPAAYRRWDTVLTPYTPENAVHRVRMRGGQCHADVAGSLDQAGLLSDLNFLFPQGYELRSVEHGLRGALAAPDPPVRWPENIAPLGRAAEWTERSLGHVVDGAYALLRRWLR